MQASDLRELTVAELEDKERELAGQLFALRLQRVTGQLENPSKVKLTRREMARVLTVKREKAGQEEAS